MKKLLILLFAFIGTNALAASDDDLIYKLSFDLGVASSTYNGFNYTEAEVGLNTYFNPYLDWRNGIWGRWTSGQTSVYGLDSSVRGVFSEDAKAIGFTVFAGPGVRFPTLGNITPFAEGGVVLKLVGFAVGVGAKTLFNSWVTSGVPNDSQVFLILGVGGAL